jgi:transposase-like protein
MSDEDAPEMPRCPRCQGPMALVRIWPKSSAFPEYRSYQCVDCKQVETYEHKERARPGTPLRRRISDFPDD